MTHRSWRALQGGVALAALMLIASPASAQFYENEEREELGYESGFGDYTGNYYNEMGEEAEYGEDYTGYYEEDQEDDWF